MNVSDLIDYLQQFPGETRVVLKEVGQLQENVPFIELEYLDYDEDSDNKL